MNKVNSQRKKEEKNTPALPEISAPLTGAVDDDLPASACRIQLVTQVQALVLL